ncbi:DNA-directed RNA polymerase III subunit RPC4 [Vigna umbellata]|uniref:DNA-directed RNA polymerase III subunit RPC4 n=1 Tax=Vigna umbellata TaxID=87088 RepID=UPI001F5F64DD|nr:DNA-directed RNA polymerase III subunit RPC4 [Vigna umbellata]
MDSEPSPQVRRKHKFAPRAPPRLVPKKEVKSEVIENAEADANRAKDLLRRFNESAMRARNKVEKKVSASQIAFGYGGESTSLKSYGIARDGRSVNINQNSASSAVAEKEYTEPWDYYSNYPVTLPVRRPYSGNPELLDEEEFGEAAESTTYDEDASNSAMELGFLEENLEANMFLIKLPPKLPMVIQSSTDGGKDVNAKAKPPGGSKKVEKLCELKDLPSGFVGKMLVYKSGKIKLKLGNTLYDVSSGMNCGFSQDVVAINTAEKNVCSIGEISKHATVTPDIDAIVDNLSDF